LGTRKPKRGDVPTKPFSSPEGPVRPTITSKMQASYDKGKQAEFRTARREEAIKFLRRYKAGLSPKILNEPTTLPPGRRGTPEYERNLQRATRKIERPETGNETEAGRRARDEENDAALAALSKRLYKEGLQLDRYLQNAGRIAESLRKFRLRREDRGGAYSRPPLATEFNVPPEVMERVAARIKSGKVRNLVKGPAAVRLLARLRAMGNKK